MQIHKAFIGIGLAVQALLSFGAQASEDGREVTLRMKGGGFEVTGEIRFFDGQKYVVESPQLGRLTLQAARFDCVGSACTAPAAAAAWTYEPLSPERRDIVAARGNDVVAQQLLPAMIRGYAAGTGLSVVQVIGTSPRQSTFKLFDQRSRELAEINIQIDDAASGIGAVERGAATIAMTDRLATKEETEALAAASPKIRTSQSEHFLGIDGLAIVVAPDNPVSSLPIDIIARLFSGQITDWYELGLPPGRVRLLLRDASANSDDRLQSVVLRPRNLKVAETAERVASDAELADAVARDRTALGFVSLAMLRNTKAVNIESSCGLIQRPTPFALKAGEYPLSRRLYLYSAAPPKEAAARGLLRYALSAEGQAILSDNMIAGQAVEQIPLSDQAERMAFALNAQGEAFDLPQMRAMLADFKGARRLSSTFRFVPGTQDLDAASRTEVGRLAQLLMTAEFANKRILLAAFTDANGAKFQSNLTHSYKRSGQVRSALLSASGQKIDHRLLLAKGYGPLAPVACNDTGEGQRLNRRVEVWIKD